MRGRRPSAAFAKRHSVGRNAVPCFQPAGIAKSHLVLVLAPAFGDLDDPATLNIDGRFLHMEVLTLFRPASAFRDEGAASECLNQYTCWFRNGQNMLVRIRKRAQRCHLPLFERRSIEGATRCIAQPIKSSRVCWAASSLTQIYQADDQWLIGLEDAR